MNSCDIHPEYLLEKEAQGALTQKEKRLLDDHCSKCQCCSTERNLIADFWDELKPKRSDHLIIERVANRLTKKQKVERKWQIRATSAVAAGFILVFAGTVSALWAAFIINDEPYDELVETQPDPQKQRPTSGTSSQIHTNDEEDLSQHSDDAPSSNDAQTIDHPPITVGKDPREAPTSKGQKSDRSGSSENAGYRFSNEKVDAATLFSLANQARIEKKYSRAADLYRELATKFPNSRQEVASRISYGRLLLDHLRKPKLALRLFKQYLQDKPDGSLSPEAHVGWARSCEQLGKTEKEMQAWRSLLAKFPSSIYASRARERIKVLGDRDGS